MKNNDNETNQNGIKIGIYKITSPSNKVYVGQSININKRWYVYKLLKFTSQLKLFRSLLKYNPSNHIFEIIEECKVDELDEKETHYKKIELNKVGGDWSKVLFCELHDKGGGPKSEEGRKRIKKGYTNEIKKKMSQSKIGKFHSQETKDKISKTKSGVKVHSKKSKENIRKALIGKNFTEEHKNKISMAKMGMKYNKKII